MRQDGCAAFIVSPVTVMVPEPAGAETAPVPEGHVVVAFGAAATATFAGSVSVKLMPDCAGLPAPLVSVKVSVDMPFWLIAAGENALLSEAWTTMSGRFVTALLSTPPTVMLPAPL